MIATLALRQTANHHRGIPLTASLTGNRSKAGPQPGSRALFSFKRKVTAFYPSSTKQNKFFSPFLGISRKSAKPFAALAHALHNGQPMASIPPMRPWQVDALWQFTLAVERDLKPLSALPALALSMANKLIADIEPLVSPMKKIYHTLPFRIAITQPKGIVAPLIFYP